MFLCFLTFSGFVFQLFEIWHLPGGVSDLRFGFSIIKSPRVPGQISEAINSNRAFVPPTCLPTSSLPTYLPTFLTYLAYLPTYLLTWLLTFLPTYLPSQPTSCQPTSLPTCWTPRILLRVMRQAILLLAVSTNTGLLSLLLAREGRADHYSVPHVRSYHYLLAPYHRTQLNATPLH